MWSVVGHHRFRSVLAWLALAALEGGVSGTQVRVCGR